MRTKSQLKVKRGAALVTVLMVVGLATVASSALIGSAFVNLNVSVKQDSTNIARNLADSAIHLAADNALKNPGLFLTGGGVSLYPSFTVTPSAGNTAGTNTDSLDPNKDMGVCTFVQTTTTPWSLNNLGPGLGPALPAMHGFNGRNVPANSLHLVGIGTCKSTKVVTEALLYLPPYPYVICANGKLSATGNLLVGSVNSSGTLDGAGLNNVLTNPTQLLPGDIANNLNQANSLTLDPSGQKIYIAGNVQTTSSGVNTPSGMANITIGGQEEPNSDPAPQPTININSYDPLGQPVVATVTGTSGTPLTGVYSLSGYGRSSGDLYIQGGTLDMHGGVLFVNGNLSINNVGMNAVQGKGAIFCTGNVVINGPTQLASDDTLALCAKGDITIEGGASVMNTAPSFSGLLYTQGNLTIDHVSVVGSYVANGDTSVGKGNIILNDANLINATDKGTVSLPQPAGGYAPQIVTTVGITGAGIYGPPFTGYKISATAQYDGTTVTYTGITISGGPPPVPVAAPVGTFTDVSFQAWFKATFCPAINVNSVAAKNLKTIVAFTGPGGLTAQTQAMVLANSWPNAPGGAIVYPPTSGNPPSTDPTTTFNEFIDPLDQARVLIWQSPTPMAPIYGAPF